MTDSESNRTSWQSEVCAALVRLTVDDLPSLEVQLIDGLAAWILSPENPGRDYSNEHGATVISTLLTAVQRAPEYRPDRQPAETGAVRKLRAKVVDGASDLGADLNGITTLTTRLMPAAIGELERNSGDPAAQIVWTYYYSILVLASGKGETPNEKSMNAIHATFSGWDQLMANGFVVPWRRQ